MRPLALLLASFFLALSAWGAPECTLKAPYPGFLPLEYKGDCVDGLAHGRGTAAVQFPQQTGQEIFDLEGEFRYGYADGHVASSSRSGRYAFTGEVDRWVEKNGVGHAPIGIFGSRLYFSFKEGRMEGRSYVPLARDRRPDPTAPGSAPNLATGTSSGTDWAAAARTAQAQIALQAKQADAAVAAQVRQADAQSSRNIAAWTRQSQGQLNPQAAAARANLQQQLRSADALATRQAQTADANIARQAREADATTARQVREANALSAARVEQSDGQSRRDIAAWTTQSQAQTNAQSAAAQVAVQQQAKAADAGIARQTKEADATSAGQVKQSDTEFRQDVATWNVQARAQREAETAAAKANLERQAASAKRILEQQAAVADAQIRQQSLQATTKTAKRNEQVEPNLDSPTRTQVSQYSVSAPVRSTTYGASQPTTRTTSDSSAQGPSSSNRNAARPGVDSTPSSSSSPPRSHAQPSSVGTNSLQSDRSRPKSSRPGDDSTSVRTFSTASASQASPASAESEPSAERIFIESEKQAFAAAGSMIAADVVEMGKGAASVGRAAIAGTTAIGNATLSAAAHPVETAKGIGQASSRAGSAAVDAITHPVETYKKYDNAVSSFLAAEYEKGRAAGLAYNQAVREQRWGDAARISLPYAAAVAGAESLAGKAFATEAREASALAKKHAAPEARPVPSASVGSTHPEAAKIATPNILEPEGRRTRESGVETLHQHHPWPKYLGGDPTQELEGLPKSLHQLYHSKLDRVLPRQRGGEFYEGLTEREKAKVRDDFKAFTQAFDKANGTRLWEAALKNGFPDY